MVYKDNGIVWQDFSCTSPLIKVWNSLDRGNSVGISRYKLDKCFSEKFIFHYNPIPILHILNILVMFHDKLHLKLELFKMPRTSSILFNIVKVSFKNCISFIWFLTVICTLIVLALFKTQFISHVKNEPVAAVCEHAITPSPHECPYQWTEFGGHCYRFFKGRENHSFILFRGGLS